MKPSDGFGVPLEAALPYDFLNTLDLRAYVEGGIAHRPTDELADTAGLQRWLSDRSLLDRGRKITVAEHRAALGLLNALRDFISLEPTDRAQVGVIERLSAACAGFPMIAVGIDKQVDLRPISLSGAGGLGAVIAQIVRLSTTGRLERLKSCRSAECKWVFFDRSKPANRCWCSSERCGNREKTRGYRLRQRMTT